MSTIRSADGVRLALLGLAVLATRLPFLLPGYGTDPDAWRVADVARAMHETGRYGASRLPPHPVQEIVSAWLWPGGAFALNAATAFLSVLAALCFVLLLRRLRLPFPVLSGLALAATPAFFVGSTVALDYAWAMGLFLLAVWLAASGRASWAGVALGLAIGSRLSYGVFLVPVAMLLAPPGGGRGAAILRCAGVTLLVAALTYVPVMLEYGLGFVRHYQLAYPGAILILKQATLDLWGPIGAVGIAASLGLLGLRAATGKPFPVSAPEHRPWVAFSLATILLTAALYLLVPHDAAYLLPAVPFILLLGALWLPRGAYLGLCVSLLATPWLCKIAEEPRPYTPAATRHAVPFSVGGFRLRAEPFQGPILYDHERRRTEERYVRALLADSARGEDRIVIVHEWLPMIRVLAGGERTGAARFVRALPLDSLRAYLGRGAAAYYLPEADWPNELQHGYRLREHGAQELMVTP